MIVVDANVILRHVVQPATENDRLNGERATRLIKDVENGRVEMTCSDAIVAEVVYILSARTHYHTPRALVVTALKPLLQMRGFKLANKRAMLSALDLWEHHSQLSFPDALGAAHAALLNAELATLDERLAKLPIITAFAFAEIQSDANGDTVRT